MATTTATNERAQERPGAGRIAAAGDALALIGVVAGGIALFLHNWVRVDVMYAARGASGGGALQRLGTEVDKQIAAITEHEVNATISPTLWQYPSHGFQALCALFLLVAAAVLLAPSVPPRWRVRARAAACVMSAVAVIVVAVAFARIEARIAGLPARILAAMESNPLVKPTLAVTNGAPQVSGGPGWPMVVVAAGALLALIGTLAGLIVALRAPGGAGILPQGRETTRTGRANDGNAMGEAAVPDDGPAADAHRDPRPL